MGGRRSFETEELVADVQRLSLRSGVQSDTAAQIQRASEAVGAPLPAPARRSFETHQWHRPSEAARLIDEARFPSTDGFEYSVDLSSEFKSTLSSERPRGAERQGSSPTSRYKVSLDDSSDDAESDLMSNLVDLANSSE